MRCSEWIAAAYFLYLILPVWRNPSLRARQALVLQALLSAAVVVIVSRLPDTSAGLAIRDWAPGVYLLAGYWLSGRLFTSANERLERWLIETDRAWLGEALAAATAKLPTALVNYLELSYLLCYPLVPVAFGLLYFFAGNGPIGAAASDTFWSAVLLAVFTCYGLLPWLPTRPPRAFLPPETTSTSPLRRINVRILNRASIQVNTFPSGHVAAALAAALAVGQFLPAAGAIIVILALSIAVASVLGRYHYLADAVLGALAALAAFAVAELG